VSIIEKSQKKSWHKVINPYTTLTLIFNYMFMQEQEVIKWLEDNPALVTVWDLTISCGELIHCIKSWLYHHSFVYKVFIEFRL